METRDLGRESRESLPKASIHLEFFRHDDKAKAAEGQPDTTVRLTEKGRKHASEVGKEKNPNPEVAVAFGSSRERSVETAMRQMLADQPEIGEDTTLEDIKELVAGSVKVGRKDMVDERLNFVWEGQFKDAAMDHYVNKKDYLLFAVEESDDLVRKLKDHSSTSYSRQAAGIAEIVRRYLEILPNFQRLVADNPDKYLKFQNELQRFLGSHATVTESFLMKVIEKTKGRDDVMKFIESLPDKNGFGFSEGFSLDLVGDETGTDIVLKYKDQQWELTPELIDEIIKDKEALDLT